MYFNTSIVLEGYLKNGYFRLKSVKNIYFKKSAKSAPSYFVQLLWNIVVIELIEQL